jgi:hypothetical protein
MLQTFHIGLKVFSGLSAAAATRMLRRHLTELGVEGAKIYSLHSFRRGAAQDAMEAGCTLEFLLTAGGWSSRACFTYIKSRDLCNRAAMEFIVDNSDSECDEPCARKGPSARV